MPQPDENLATPPPDEDILYEASVAAGAAEPDDPPDEPEPDSASEESGPQTQSRIPPPQEFDPRYREPFTGLMHLGHLEKTVTLWGHTFHLATPSQHEKIRVGLLHKEFQGTLAQEIAYQTLMVAAHLRWVDDHELPRPVTRGPHDAALNERFKWVGENLHDGVIDELWSEVLVLQQDVRDVLAAMGKASG